jgi:SAM-dependent methyltransferase
VAKFRKNILSRHRGRFMSGFSADWLALREPYDLAARNGKVLDAVAAAFSGKHQIRVVDLACGTGSTVRALAPRLATGQHWQLVDNDLSLLGRAASSAARPGVTITTVPIDLNRDLEAALDGPVDLVTTSALLDLVSEEWLDRLAVETLARNIPLYAALSYDGRIKIAPRHPLDEKIAAAVNAHQRGNKGFGPALGPAAAQTCIARFQFLGSAVVHGTSDWVAGNNDREFQREVFNGWANAAREMSELPLPDIVEWLTFRRDHVGRSSLRVGHVDIFARPAGTR